MTVIEGEALNEVRSSFSGELLQAGDTGYDDARQVHNGVIDKRPALIARCRTTADVADAVRLARQADAEIAVRGGGHNVAGRACTDGGVMIDLAPMRGIYVDPKRRTVRAQGGTTWGEYNRAAAVHGLATTGGVISTTGVAGLTLGGGIGWLMGKHGLSIDNLLAVELVSAEGEVLTVSEDEHPDLFWALRGGGGNFGVAASLEFAAHPLTTVLGGIVAHPLASATEVLRYYREFVEGAPDEVTAFAGLVHAPDGSGDKIVGIPLCHCGPLDQAERDLAPLRSFGPPAIDLVQPMPYPVVNTLLDEGFPKGARNYWKSAFLSELTDETVGILVDAFARTPSAMSGMVIEYFHGEAVRVPPTATAFPHRQAGYNLVIAGEWLDPAEDDANIAWVRELFAALAPFTADRTYVNYMDADESERVRAAYGPNWDRLVEVKRQYDPNNVFRLNQNIDPSS
ncbi:MAG TPA: FAD-binding oxidoreductase [Acidimicrobiales bacterium]|nr:FAD-binding oxidoreductase [Acidimicrobiales bacterium]